MSPRKPRPETVAEAEAVYADQDRSPRERTRAAAILLDARGVKPSIDSLAELVPDASPEELRSACRVWVDSRRPLEERKMLSPWEYGG